MQTIGFYIKHVVLTLPNKMFALRVNINIFLIWHERYDFKQIYPMIFRENVSLRQLIWAVALQHLLKKTHAILFGKPTNY